MRKTILSQSIALSIILSLASHANANSTQAEESCKNSTNKPQCIEDYTKTPEATLDTITITANRTATNMVDYAGQVSVLGENELSDSNTIIETLSQVPGVDFGNDFGRQIGQQYQIRGYGYQSDERVIVEQDGVQRDPVLYSNHISSFRTDTNLLKEVEVVKGGSSVVHGSGAIGGVVSMQTKEAQDYINEGKDYGVTIGGRYDSNNSKSGHFALTADPEDSSFDFLAYRRQAEYGNIELAGSGANETKEISNDEDIDTTYVKLGWDITDEHRADISYYDYDETLDTSWQTLWHLDVDEEEPIKGHLEQKDLIFNYSYIPHNNNWIDLDTKFYKTDASYYRAWTDDAGNYTNYYENSDERWGINVKNVSKFDIGNVNNSLVAGIDYENRDGDAVMLSKGENVDFGAAVPNFHKDFGFYLQNQSDIGKFNTTLGARYDNFKRGGRESDYRETHLSPKVSIGYELLDGLHVIGGYAETFRAPTPNEVASSGPINPWYWLQPNADLKPEIAKEYEVGFAVDKQAIFTDSDEMYLKATYFDGGIDDMINLTTTSEAGAPPDVGDGHVDRRSYATYKNINEVERKGVEVEGKYRLGDWELGTGFDYIKITDREDDSLVQPSTKKAYTNFGYDDQDTGLGIGLKVTHWFKPKRDEYELVSRGKTYKYVNDDFTLVDVNAHWNPNNTGIGFVDDGMKVNFGINNLFDDQRINPNKTETTTAVGKGRNFYLGLEKTF